MTMRKVLIGLAALAGLAAVTYQFAVKPFRSWGLSQEEATATLPGDEVIPDAVGGETRAITIEASSASVWPWLVQMGSGRGGWYSYDSMDPGVSSREILPEFQALAEGDMVPTSPKGGLVVRRLEPEHALVLYFDSEMSEEQSGAKSPTEFAVTWAFILEPLPDNRTRLIERIRYRFGETDKPWIRYTLPMMGFGVFVVLRKQLEGIKERAEQAPAPAQVTA
jgi:hypothetical protein